jgi:hypothetical protein
MTASRAKPTVRVNAFVSGYTSTMDKKEINSPKLTANFLFWVCGVGGVLLVALLGHYVWKIF